jgi:protein involved in polysaccharide export with SLBB domain
MNRLLANLLLVFALATHGLWMEPLAAHADVAAAPAIFKLKVNRSQAGRKYLLGPSDVLSISVLDSPEYDQTELTVQPDGKLTVAPLGSINVTGMTMEELHDAVVDKFKFYLNDPHITIKLDRTKAFIVPVTGAVLKPGSVELVTTGNNNIGPNTEVANQRRTPLLSNVLLSAGGVSYDADIEHIVIKNELDDSEFEVNLMKYLKEGDASQDVYLVSGDTVFVPRVDSPLAVNVDNYKVFQRASFAPRTVPVKVYGYVQQPGLVQLNPDQSTNLNSAIGAAGGFQADAAYVPSKIRISRQTEQGKLVEWWVDPRKEDTMLMPNDIVYVPQKPLPRVGLFFDYVNRIIAPVGGIASTYNSWALMFDPQRFQIVPNNTRPNR